MRALKSAMVNEVRSIGSILATALPPRSTTYVARSSRTRSTSLPKFFAASVADTRAPTPRRRLFRTVRLLRMLRVDSPHVEPRDEIGDQDSRLTAHSLLLISSLS